MGRGRSLWFKWKGFPDNQKHSRRRISSVALFCCSDKERVSHNLTLHDMSKQTGLPLKRFCFILFSTSAFPVLSQVGSKKKKKKVPKSVLETIDFCCAKAPDILVRWRYCSGPCEPSHTSLLLMRVSEDGIKDIVVPTFWLWDISRVSPV